MHVASCASLADCWISGFHWEILLSTSWTRLGCLQPLYKCQLVKSVKRSFLQRVNRQLKGCVGISWNMSHRSTCIKNCFTITCTLDTHTQKHHKTSQTHPWRFSRTPSLATASTVSQSKPQTLRSTRPTTLDPILQGPQGPRPRPAVSTSWQKPGLASSRCFRRSRKSSKPGMASRMKNDVIRCSKSRSVRNVIPWLYLNIAKIDVFLPFFTISGSWLLFREHIWQRTWRCSRSMGLPLSHNSLRLLAELILQNCW